MKTIIEKGFGGDGATTGLYVEGQALVAKVSYPLSEALEPLYSVIDKAIDKVEQLIPGDQTGIAAKLKAEAREELTQLLGA